MNNSTCIIFDPANETQYRFYTFSDPIDVERNIISENGRKIKYHIELLESTNDDVVEICFKEENHHKSVVQIFDHDLRICSCDQYYNHQCGYCKHISVLDYMSDKYVYTDKEQKNFIKKIEKAIEKLNKTKKKCYHVFDSLKEKIVKIGDSVDMIKSYSLLTKEKHDNISHLETNNITIDNPYFLLDNIFLYDYQNIILNKMLNAKRAICSMVMGTGKTILSIAGIHYLKTENILIVCPKSIINQWSSEILRLTGYESIVLNKKNIEKYIHSDKDRIGICTYQTYSRNFELLSQKTYKLVIADEIQFIKNEDSKTWTHFKKINTDYFWGLSGTVIENRLDDLYNIMDVVAPGTFKAKWKFNLQFKKLKSIHRFKVLYANETINIDELKNAIASNVFSYDKLDLPDPIIVKHYIDLDKESQDKQNEYVYLANKLISKSLQYPLTFSEKIMLQSYQLRARQCCNSLELIDKKPRLNEKIKKIINVIDKTISNGNKIIVYSEWTTMLDIICNYLQNKYNYVMFDGSLSSKKRYEIIQKFIHDSECMIFFSSDAGGLGVDGLQHCCSNMIHIELPWNPAKIDQRIGRIRRLGQKRQVNVFYFIAKNTIEDRINALIEDKRKVRMDTLF